MTAVTEPNGCAVCGIPQREHGQRYHGAAGFGLYIPPSDAVRLARMRARRTTAKEQP